MNMFKKNGGFTLVELIVVIAILAILAGVAVPVYSGYITKANAAADMTLLDSVKTAVVFAVADEDPAVNVETITVTEGTTTVEVTVDDEESDIESVDISAYVSEIEFKSGTTATLDLTAETPKWEIAE